MLRVDLASKNVCLHILLVPFSSSVPGPVTGVTFTNVSDSKIIVTWREPEVTNGLIVRYIITVTLYSTGQTVYTNVVSAGRGLSVNVTGLGEMHGSTVVSLT